MIHLWPFCLSDKHEWMLHPTHMNYNTMVQNTNGELHNKCCQDYLVTFSKHKHFRNIQSSWKHCKEKHYSSSLMSLIIIFIPQKSTKQDQLCCNFLYFFGLNRRKKIGKITFYHQGADIRKQLFFKIKLKFQILSIDCSLYCNVCDIITRLCIFSVILNFLIPTHNNPPPSSL